MEYNALKYDGMSLGKGPLKVLLSTLKNGLLNTKIIECLRIHYIPPGFECLHFLM